MEKIRQWTIMLSSVAVVSGVLVALLPKSSHKNLYKVIVSIVLIYALLLPLTEAYDFDFNISDYLRDNYAVSENIDMYAQNTLLRSAEKTINDILSDEALKADISCEFITECEVIDSNVEVIRITVHNVADESKKSKIGELIVALGFDEKIIVFAGEEYE